jgi:NADPH-dependent curcumin reductase CurA
MTPIQESPTDIPSYQLPGSNRQVLLVRRPIGIPQADDFAITATSIPVVGAGQFMVRNIYLSVDPAQRGWASSEANYAVSVALGNPMRALAIAVVVESNDPDFESGAFLYGWFDWQDYAIADASKVVLRARKPLPLSAFASLLGINGLTAYLALTELGRPAAGDTLLVSTAAGSVGSFVGQIGRILGCSTFGLTGDDRKAERCIARYGYDAAVNYKTADLAQALEGMARGGFDIYFDNTGGDILDAALRQMKPGGRVVQCGTASISDWTARPLGLRNEREVLTRRLAWSGFVLFDHAARYAGAADQLASWFLEGRLTYDEDISDDIAAAPGAIAALYRGENAGKKLIYVGGTQ